MAADRNVAWKAFQLQSALLCRKASSDTMAECKDWLSPNQLYEVVVERNVSGYCGWPLCGAAITHTTKGVKAPGSDAKNDQFERNEFCSPSCHADVQNFVAHMDANPIGVRSGSAKGAPKAPTKITDLLDVFAAIDLENPDGEEVDIGLVDNGAAAKPKNPPPAYGAPPVVQHPGAGVKQVVLPKTKAGGDGDEETQDQESTAEEGGGQSPRGAAAAPKEQVVLINGIPTALPVIDRATTFGASKGGAPTTPAAKTTPRNVSTPHSAGSNSSTPSTASSTPRSVRYKEEKKRPTVLSAPPAAMPLADTFISLGAVKTAAAQPRVILPFDEEGNVCGNVPRRVTAKDQSSVDKWFKEGETATADGRRGERGETVVDTSTGGSGVRKVTFSGDDPVPKAKEVKAKPVRAPSAAMVETAKLAGLIDANRKGGDPSANAHLYLNATVVEKSAPAPPGANVGEDADSDMAQRPQKRSMDRRHRDGAPLSQPFDPHQGEVPGGAAPDPRSFLNRMKAVKEQKVVAAADEPKFPIGHKRLVPKHLKGKAASQPSMVIKASPDATKAAPQQLAPVASLGKPDVNDEPPKPAPKEPPKKLKEKEKEMKQTMSSPLLGGAGVGLYTMHATGKTPLVEDDDDVEENAPGSQTKFRLSAEDQKLWQEMFGKEYRSDGSDSEYASEEQDDRFYGDESASEDEDDEEDEEDYIALPAGSDLEGEQRVTLTVVEPRAQDRPPTGPNGAGAMPASPQARLPPHLRNKPVALAADSPAKERSPAAGSAKKRSAEKAAKPAHVENSVFKVMWCLLDDLLGHHNSVLQAVIDSDKPAPSPGTPVDGYVAGAAEGSVDEEVEDEEQRIAALAMQRQSLPPKDNKLVRNSVLTTFVERGISLAEQQLDIQGGFKVLSDSQGLVYHRKKSFFVGALLSFNDHTVGLGERKARILMDQVTSVEWNMLGLLVVDALFRSVGLLSSISIDDGLSSVSTPKHSQSTRAAPSPGPPAPIADVSFDPVVATAANVDALWLAKLDHAFKGLITKYNAANSTQGSGVEGIRSAVAGAQPSMSYLPLQDRELHHLRCFFNG
jgi:hypothetical protein